MPETILIVDDTPANVSVLLQCLGDRGYRLMVAEDGEECLAQIAHTVPDLVLLDVMMPGIDGFDTCRRIHELPGAADLPVIFMTALTETTDKVKGFTVGAVDYITKPIQHEEALARVSTHLALRRLRTELKRELELKERFMRIAAHDLRNPLCLILMAGELAKRQKDAPAGISDCLQDIHESANQMRRIIDTFLQLKRPGTEPAVQRVDLNALAAAVVSQNEPAAERKQIKLRLEAGTGLPPACGDVAHVYQALTNYVTNSLKFTPPEGVVTVHTRFLDGRIRAEVEDNGPGVSPAERGQLFTEYARLSNRPTAGEESNGLGLAIVKELIGSLHGNVGADFPDRGGSVFWFELPPAEPAV